MAKSEIEKEEFIEVYGAREHNLKNIDIKIPRNKLVVITGISGSGKSSLAFDTIYAEGQRRYMESFSAYARSFMGNMERPDVDKIDGLSPVISIEQKTTSKNPRSTVGTVTEIYDFLRLLYARAGVAYSHITGNKMIKQSEDQIIDHILNNFNSQKLTLLAPIVKGRKGHYREDFQKIKKLGFTKARVDGLIVEIEAKTEVDRYKIHDIEVVIDRIVPKEEDRFRISQSVKTAMNMGKGVIMCLVESKESENKKEELAGKGVYATYCSVCHQPDGKGIANMNPTLVNKEWVGGDKAKIIKVVLNGLSGKITVDGVPYESVMASHDFLTDKQIADVLTYVRKSFG
ncbi:MAG: hypothetical protein EAZ27_13970, partial [Cytophagales bacterium]